MYPTVTLGLPDWLNTVIRDGQATYPTAESRMRLVIELATANVRHGGGPFGAGVFDLATHRLIAPGVNTVLASHCSAAHAEIVALVTAQRVLGTHDLSQGAPNGCELVTSAEPCAMCMGAVPWSGVQSLVCGARGEDACAIGFDEGAKPENWTAELEQRGIAVTRDVCREEAVAVLRDYRDTGGIIYNPEARPA